MLLLLSFVCMTLFCNFASHKKIIENLFQRSGLKLKMALLLIL